MVGVFPRLKLTLCLGSIELHISLVYIPGLCGSATFVSFCQLPETLTTPLSPVLPVTFLQMQSTKVKHFCFVFLEGNFFIILDM